MPWIAPQPPVLTDEPTTGADRPILRALLAYQRRTLLNICAGLTGEQLAERALPPSTLSLLGLVRHMAKVERTWFCERVAGQDLEPMYDATLGKDADFDDLDAEQAEADFDRFTAACRAADDAAADVDLDFELEDRGDLLSLRFVYLHMLTEYARHNGHADLLRERLDGTTGR
ncbi:MAG: DinB family protein [bacterium]